MSKDATVAFNASELMEELNSAEKEAQERVAAFLVVGGELNGTLFNLEGGQIKIGRNPDNHIPLEFNGISRYHFHVLEMPGNLHKVEDLESKNGTFVNNKKITESVVLKKGDIVKIGGITLKYLPKGDPERLTYDKLSLEANTDGHTGCYNKTYFNNALELQVKKARLTGNPLSLIIFDLDHFKGLNDTHGHDAGDFVLKELAALVRENGVRGRNDTFARYGGEEFCILLPDTNLKYAFEIAERLRKLVEAHQFTYDGKRLPVTMSIGLSDYREGVAIGQDLFKRADEAVYKSKEEGRNRVSFYKDE